MRGIRFLPKKAHYWHRLQSVLEDLEQREGYVEQMEPLAMLAMETLMANITREQPYGHEEYDPDGYYAVGTVSERIGHTPIEDGWRTEITEGEGGRIKMRLRNISEHIRYVILGTPPHPEPKTSPFVFFWWGAPQRWPAPEFNRRTGRKMGPGYYKFPMINHPGQDPNPFVARAKDQSRPVMAQGIRLGTAGWVRAVMRRFGLKEK